MTAFLFVPSLVGDDYHNFAANVLFTLFIMSSLALIHSKSIWLRTFTYFVGIVGITAEIVHKFIREFSDFWQVVFVIILFIYFITLIGELLRQVFNTEKITLNVVLGAFTGYIMIGIIGYFVFRLIFILNPSSFAIPEYSSQDLIYFTFITLTTIGYGDISPLSDAARNFAIILGLIGQFYNTIIIAIIIGKFLQR
jgi:hypothetical protein